MNTIITYGIIYLLVFRLAVLLLGGLCIFLGYRLFLSVRQQAGSSPDTADQGSELHGKLGTSELTIKSTAPGIFFAAFGAIIVIAVLAGQQPTVAYDTQQSQPSPPQAGQPSEPIPIVTQQSVAMRDTAPSSHVPSDAGTEDYNSVLLDIPNAIDRLRTAVSLVPDNPDYHDLLARLLFAWGESEKAVAEQHRAVKLVEEARREDFQARLDLYEQVAR
ncbi:MAG: hypothetical protein D3911_09160 [Candidatus Electrothrix sp. AW3_4]|nr:hypothetical protein [Candidatus Electrothrix gigas]